MKKKWQKPRIIISGISETKSGLAPTTEGTDGTITS